MTLPGPPQTARGLLEAVAGFDPRPGTLELDFSRDPPAELWDALRVLQTGVRAALTGRRWAGCDSTSGRAQWLSPDRPVPAGVGLLAVEGDARWDRIPADARRVMPRLFSARPHAPGQPRPSPTALPQPAPKR